MLVAVSLGGCSNQQTDSQSAAMFTDIAPDVGLDFEHQGGAVGEFLFPEILGAGAALVDYDNDGDLDVFLIQSGNLKSDPASNPGNRVFRNELVPSGTLRFTDTSDATGFSDRGYGMGIASGDYDNDGHTDLYVTNFGSNVLYRNQGDGTFVDVTAKAGADDKRWSTSAAFIDIDRDGDLDLFVATYAQYTVADNHVCKDSAARADYCAPSQYPASSDTLLQNNGDGTFTNISESSAIAGKRGPGLGVLGADFDGDGWLDIFVANDKTANFLWRNLGNGVFEETGLMAGVAYNANGEAEASMGVTAGDFDGDGDDDLFMTHLTSETNTLYENTGSGRFVDITATSGLGHVSLSQTGFGSRWFDADNDGDLDLFVANGAVAILNERADLSRYPYEQANQLFENTGNQRFVDVSDKAGFAAMTPRVSRGAAFGDIDNDGDVDVLVSNNHGIANLLRNNSEHASSSLTVKLIGTSSSRDAQGARIALTGYFETPVWRRIHADGSFASASDIQVHFGLGDNDDRVATKQPGFIVEWPNGVRETWTDLAPSRHYILTEGTGHVLP